MASSSVIEPCLPSQIESWADDAWQRVSRSEALINEDPDRIAVDDAVWSHRIEDIHADPDAVFESLNGAEAADDATIMAANHVRVVLKMAGIAKQGLLPNPMQPSFLSWINTELFSNVSLSALAVSQFRFMEPGRFRERPEESVVVGRHVPPTGPEIEACLKHLARSYGSLDSSNAAQLVAAAASHHRFCYVHPFLDGNGRVGRLAATAMFMRAGLAAGTKWSLARAMAEPHSGRYHDMIAYADMPRQGDLDGRGNLSERALKEFCQWTAQAVSHEADRRAAPTTIPGVTK